MGDSVSVGGSSSSPSLPSSSPSTASAGSTQFDSPKRHKKKSHTKKRKSRLIKSRAQGTEDEEDARIQKMQSVDELMLQWVTGLGLEWREWALVAWLVGFGAFAVWLKMLEEDM